MDIVQKSREYAFKAHSDTNHLYDNKPYGYHLEMVYNIALKFIYLIPVDKRDVVLAGCYVHDCIEDARQTYNDVVEHTSEEVGNIAYALTNEKGRNRKERANKKYYDGIKENELFIFVKICDRLANIKYSKEKGSKMSDVYRKEFDSFKANLYTDRYKDMWELLERLIDPNTQPDCRGCGTGGGFCPQCAEKQKESIREIQTV